jgi:hypothetical protein
MSFLDARETKTWQNNMRVYKIQVGAYQLENIRSLYPL